MTTVTYDWSPKGGHVLWKTFDPIGLQILGVILVSDPSKESRISWHPFSPITSEPREYVSSPFSTSPLHDCYHEQVSGVVSFQHADPKWFEGLFNQHKEPFVGQVVIPLTVGFQTQFSFENDEYEWTGEIKVMDVKDKTSYFTLIYYRDLRRVRKADGTFWRSHSGSKGQKFTFYKNKDIIPHSFGDTLEPPPGLYDIGTPAYALAKLEERLDEDDSMNWGTLCLEASKSIRSLDINSLAYIRDGINIAKAALSLAKGDLSATAYGTFKSAYKHHRSYYKASAKTAASVYLSNHYGTRLTIADTDRINKLSEYLHSSDTERFYGHDAVNARAFPLFQRCAASHSISLETHPLPGATNVKVTRTVSATLRSFSDNLLHAVDSIKEAEDQLVSRIKRVGYELDTLPTAANLWDLVPFSFVLDWVLPIGDRLEEIEARNYMSSLPVICVFYSEVIEYDRAITINGWESYGELHHKVYRRNCSKRLVIPSKFLSGSSISELPSHIIEGASLLVQQLL